MEEKDQEVIDEEFDDIDFEDFEDDEEETLDEASEEDEETESNEKHQSREENREFAKARRERERVKREKELQEAVEKARKEGYEKAKKEAYLENNKLNSFTGQPIKDEYDLKIYEMQKEIKEKGGDPINDLASHIAEINRNKELKTKEEQEKAEKTTASVKQQVSDFKTKFPDVDYKEVLKKDSPFRNYADGKLGGEKSIVDLYNEYQAFTKSIIEQNNLANEEEEGKKKSSSPSSTGSKSKGKKSVANMTDDEFEQYWKNKNGSF